MPRYRLGLAGLVCLLAVGFVCAAEPTVVTVHGLVEKADKTGLTFLPRTEGGRFERSITLKLTGTSNITMLTTRKQGKKMVLVQKEADVKNLKARQPIAVIYATGSEGPVLLAAVVQPVVKPGTGE